MKEQNWVYLMVSGAVVEDLDVLRKTTLVAGLVIFDCVVLVVLEEAFQFVAQVVVRLSVFAWPSLAALS